MATKTIYPYGQGGQLPSGYPIADDLVTDSAQIALSAKQGKVLGERTVRIEECVPLERKVGKYLLATGALSDAADPAVVDVFQVSPNTKNILVSGRVPSSVLYAMVAFYEADGTFISSALLGNGDSAKNYEDEGLAVPEDAVLVYVNGNTNYLEPGMKSVSLVNEPVANDVTFKPTLEYGAFSSSGVFSEMQSAAGGVATIYDRRFIRTPKYIRIGRNKKFQVTVDATMQFRVFSYDKDFGFLGCVDWQDLTANVSLTLDLEAAEYVRFDFRKSSATPVLPMFHFDLVGDFLGEYYNTRSADSGYQTVAVMVRPINAGVSNAETNAVQDDETPAYDYGLLVLPESYRNAGKPTRLIIYCHGAGVNYDGSTTRFPSNNFLPEYWLSEGYAILDMDGEFFVTNHQHACMPEARQSYIAGYNWVVENYNIRKDGVFLGGRSMGGAMCFDLMDGIPVIAACPVVPVCNTLWWWNYSPAQYREDCASKMGFVGTAPTWTSNNPMSQNEWDYLYDNFEKMVKYSPLWRCIADLPGKEVLFDGTRIASTATSGEDVEAEADIFKDLHARMRCPVKMFDNYSDPTVPYERNALLMYGMLVNAGQICELRMFDVSGDSDTSLSAHFFELRSDRKVSWTNSFGVSLTGVPVVYIEMLAFWRRYEQVNGSY